MTAVRADNERGSAELAVVMIGVFALLSMGLMLGVNWLAAQAASAAAQRALEIAQSPGHRERRSPGRGQARRFQRRGHRHGCHSDRHAGDGHRVRGHRDRARRLDHPNGLRAAAPVRAAATTMTSPAVRLFPSVGREPCLHDEGSVSVELGAGIGAWVLGVLVLATAYQVQASNDDVAHAAAEAARAASLTAAPADAADVAARTAAQRLITGPCQPGTVTVEADVADFRAGGVVRVTVVCRTRPPIGAARTLTYTAEEVIDRYRGGL
jgi:hypothetical protein